MPPDALEQLLRHADAAAPAPPLLAELPTRVRRRHERRRRRVQVGAGLAVILVPLLATMLLFRPTPPPAVVTTHATPKLTRADLAQLEMRAALHEQTAARLIEIRSSRAAARSRAAIEKPVLADVREQRDRAALVLIYQADQAARDNHNDRALAAYRRTIELFPTTYWADVARRRLKEMPT